MVAEHGYEAMSVADVVKRAAVSRNAFYKNFGDKQECFAIAHELGHERLLEILAATSDCPGSPLEPQAEPGFFCVYSAAAGTGGGGTNFNNTGGSLFHYYTPDFGSEGVGPSGTVLIWEESVVGAHAAGSFAVTAPE